MWRTLQRSQARFRTLQELHTARPDGPLAKLRFRKDGSPRSKLVGVANVSLFLLILRYEMLLREQRELTLIGAHVKALSVQAVKLQYIDMQHYNQVNFDDREECLTYFLRLLSCTLPCTFPNDTELQHQAKNAFETKVRAWIDTCHTPMKRAAEDIHREFQRFADDPFFREGTSVPTTIHQIMDNTISLISHIVANTGPANPPDVPPIMKDKGPQESGRDYDALG